MFTVNLEKEPETYNSLRLRNLPRSDGMVPVKPVFITFLSSRISNDNEAHSNMNDYQKINSRGYGYVE